MKDAFKERLKKLSRHDRIEIKKFQKYLALKVKDKLTKKEKKFIKLYENIF